MPTTIRRRESKYPGGRRYRGRRLLRPRTSTTRPEEHRDNNNGESSDGDSGSEQEFEDAIEEVYPNTTVTIGPDGVPRDAQGRPMYPPPLPPMNNTATTTASTATQSTLEQSEQPTTTGTPSSKPPKFRLPQKTPSAPPEPQIPIVNVIPSLDHIEPYKDGTSFDDYLERWEILMARYNSSSEQLALALPAKLSGAAWETYKNIIKLYPECSKDFNKLKEELSTAFKIETPLQEKNLWAITQGKKSINDFYAEIVTASRAIFKDMPEVNRNQVITSAFVGGLKESYQRAILKQGEVTLQQALKEARNLEAIDRAVAKNKVMAVTAVTHEPADPLTPLTRQIEGLAKLVSEQNRRIQQYDDKIRTDSQQPRPTVFHRPRGYNSNYNARYPNYRPRYNQYNAPRNNFQQNRRGDARPAYKPRFDMRNNYRPTTRFYNESRTDGNYRQDSYRRQDRRQENTTSRTDLPYCRVCRICHPPRRCAAVNNIDTTEFTHNTTDANPEEMTPTEFANFYLTQPPNEINNVAADPPRFSNTSPEKKPTYNRSTNGRKLGLAEQLQLTLICIFACFVGITADYHWQPNNPMICGTESKHSPQIFRIRQQCNCTPSLRNKTHMEPQEVKLMVYQKNMIKNRVPRINAPSPNP